MAILFHIFKKKRYVQKDHRSFSEFNIGKFSFPSTWFTILAPSYNLPFQFWFVEFTLKQLIFIYCKKYLTYTKTKNILKLLVVSVVLLFGISLAKWIWHSCWIRTGGKYKQNFLVMLKFGVDSNASLSWHISITTQNVKSKAS